MTPVRRTVKFERGGICFKVRHRLYPGRSDGAIPAYRSRLGKSAIWLERFLLSDSGKSQAHEIDVGCACLNARMCTISPSEPVYRFLRSLV